MMQQQVIQKKHEANQKPKQCAIVVLCVLLLTEAATQNLSRKSSKKAAMVSKLDTKLQLAKKEIEIRLWVIRLMACSLSVRQRQF